MSDFWLAALVTVIVLLIFGATNLMDENESLRAVCYGPYVEAHRGR